MCEAVCVCVCVCVCVSVCVCVCVRERERASACENAPVLCESKRWSPGKQGVSLWKRAVVLGLQAVVIC